MLFVFEFLKNSPENFTRPLASDRRGGGGTVQKPFAGYAATLESLAVDAHECVFRSRYLTFRTLFEKKENVKFVVQYLIESNIIPQYIAFIGEQCPSWACPWT